jgi:NAD(P)-dependent dehydrogenase (short-subunit alcohol dehydrogenase family)
MKACIVFGAGRGIGYELVLKLLKEGKTVIAISRIVNQLENIQNINLVIHKLDITDNRELELFYDFLVTKNFYPETVIYNAAVLNKSKFEDISKEMILNTFELNFIAPLLVIQNIIQRFQNPIHFVMISSMGGFQGSHKFGGLSVYSASKAALNNLVESLAAEYANTSYTFNALALGSVNTEMLNQAFPDFEAPLNASEMAEFIVGFSITGQKFFNGKIIPVASTTP